MSRFRFNSGRSEWRLRLTLFLLLGGATGLLAAANESPDLRPPHPEWRTSTWEHWRMVIVPLVALALLALAVLVKVWRARMPGMISLPVVEAREALRALADREPNYPDLTLDITRIVRTYIHAMIVLPSGELTTAELQAALSANTEVRLADARSITEFFRRCDQAKFAPNQPAALGLLSDAIELIGQLESGRKPAGTTTIRRRATPSNSPPPG